ncbi:MAG: sensor domain-containing diguanylate cyclase [Veillonellales bacterium]
MEEETAIEQAEQHQVKLEILLDGLNDSNIAKLKSSEALQEIVRQACSVIACDHLFISRYDASEEIFKAAAWHSTIVPGEVPLSQKFMGDCYTAKQPVNIADLSTHNYRLRPEVARLGLLSLVGIPLMDETEKVIGVMEAYAKDADHFSEQDEKILSLFAYQAAMVLAKCRLEQECRYLTAENDFLHEVLKLEQASVSRLLYKMWESVTSFLAVDGIAAFETKIQAGALLLQEVLVRGFSAGDIDNLRAVFTAELLQRFADDYYTERKQVIVKQTVGKSNSEHRKLLYMVPIIWQRAVRGILIFYWQPPHSELDMAGLERFFTRVLNHVSTAINRKMLYTHNLQKIGLTDTLTGVANRRLFDFVLDREFQQAKHSSRPLSLLMLDIDLFKQVNDHYGHPVGDQILRQMAVLMKQRFRRNDIIARYGGEEFAVILPDSDRENAVAIAELLREQIAGWPFLAGDQQIHITVSIGVATYNGSVTSVETFVQVADQGLYQAKQLGRNLTMFASTG